jgi:dynein heavy chain 1, cytosolic
VVFVKAFASIISAFQDKVDSAISVTEEIHKAIDEMKSCPYDKEDFMEQIEKIQKLVIHQI